MSKVLLLGAGSRRDRVDPVGGKNTFEGDELTTLDLNPDHKPDVVWDLNFLPWPFADDSFDEIHAYEILEHLGRQGDALSFFDHFGEIWRILREGGTLSATVPEYRSMWAWGDPSHTRVINQGSLVFLDQTEYKKQVGKTPMSDFRSIWKGDLAHVAGGSMRDTYYFKLEAVKPSRY